jgi:hypothetical protein
MSRIRSFATRHKRAFVVAGSVLGGVILGAVAVLSVPLVMRDEAAAPALEEPKPPVGTKDGQLPKMGGDMSTVMRSFTLRDFEGQKVLEVDRLSAFVDLDAMRRGLVRMPRGTVSDVKVLLRKGKSGRVSLSDALRNTTEKPTPGKSDTLLEIGPLSVKDAELTIAMGDTPIVVHVDEAVLRVQRTPSDEAPRVFLSGIRGKLLKPALPQDVTIRGADGIVDLIGGPLVDLRTRVCIGESEMKLRVVVPERKERTEITVDPSGPLGYAGLFALNVVSKVKSDKLSVGQAPVEVKEGQSCSSSAGAEEAEPAERSAARSEE